MNTAKFFIIILMVAGLGFTGCNRAGIDELLSKGKVNDAVDLCNDLEPAERKTCYIKIAEYYFRNENFKPAAAMFDKAGEYTKVISSYLLAESVAEAEEYCKKQTGEPKKICAAQLASKFYQGGSYEKSIHYYVLAGKDEKASAVKTKIPAFELHQLAGKAMETAKNHETKFKITKFRQTLKTHIYMDELLQWRYPVEAVPHKRAGEIYDKTLAFINEKAAPLFMKNLTQVAKSANWTGKPMEELTYQHVKLDILISLIQGLDKIGGLHDYFTKHSVVYYDKTGSEPAPKPDEKSFNFDQVYEMAVQHADMLLKTLAEWEEEKDVYLFPDYVNDLEADMEVVDYVSDMVDNLRRRIQDVQAHMKKLYRKKPGDSVKLQAETLLWDYIAACNEVLHKVSKKEYKDASFLLLSRYKTVKSGLARLGKD